MTKRDCEIRTPICSNSLVRTMTGVRKGDPVFRCCGACAAYLKRGGVRLKEAPDPPPKPKAKKRRARS